MTTLQQKLDSQQFANDYQLVDGVAMHAANPQHFHIPPDVIKRHLRAGQFVELRLDSSRFSMHDEDAEACSCPACDGEMRKPVLRHDHPMSLLRIETPDIPSRGWGEDFWVMITQREEDGFAGKIDNRLAETRLHCLSLGDEIVFHTNHVLAVHDVHRAELVAGMTQEDLKELAQWLGQLRTDP